MEIADKNNEKIIDEYENFVRENGCFMQSFRWAKVKCNWESEIILSRGENGEIVGGCLLLIRKIPVLGSLMYSPRGFVMRNSDSEVFSDIMSGIDILAKKYRAFKFFFDPLLTENEIPDYIKNAGFIHEKNAPRKATVQVRENYILNLENRHCEDVFGEFKSDYRCRIRKAEKRGVRCEISGENALSDFYPLLLETGKRDGFSVRKREYFERMLRSFSSDECRIFLCRTADGVPISGAVAVRFGKYAHYVYGASSGKFRELYPNYLMQWEMIKWAKSGGCEIYDFGGIPYYKEENHPAYGLYRFKRGFGGEVVEYAGEFSKLYNKLAAKIFSDFNLTKKPPPAKRKGR